MSDLGRLRNLLGASTRLWAGPDGVTLEDTRWLALSGAPSVEYNVALCHSRSDDGVIQRTIDDVIAAAVPTIVMVAGEALADVQVLVQAGWICIGATPFMALRSEGGNLDSQVRRLVPDELPLARELLEDAFSLDPKLTTVALPDASVHAEGQAVWGLFEGDELVTCAAFATAQEATVGWSIATPSRFQRRGYAMRLLRSVLAQSAHEGIDLSLVYSSAMGEPLYRKLGFRELERWQMWSRPRWVLARA